MRWAKTVTVVECHAEGESGQVVVGGVVNVPGQTAFDKRVYLETLTEDGRGLKSRNAVVVSPGRIDRSPCGTGTSARLAVLHAKGLISEGQPFIHGSITGTTFDSRVVGTATIGPYQAVIPSVAGQAWITGIRQMGLDPTDPFPQGFTLSDTWLGHAGAPTSSAAQQGNK